jgi:hypothetical protein
MKVEQGQDNEHIEKGMIEVFLILAMQVILESRDTSFSKTVDTCFFESNDACFCRNVNGQNLKFAKNIMIFHSCPYMFRKTLYRL